MSLTFIITIVVILAFAFFAVKILEKLIKLRFAKVKSILTATTAYDLCKLYADGVLSERELMHQLSMWIFVPDNQDVTKLKDEWSTILPPDPFGTFEDQVGEAYREGLISPEMYGKLMKIYQTTDDLKNRDDDEDNDY